MKKFRDMSIQERREYLESLIGKKFGELETDLETMNSMIENVVGRITLPLGVVFGSVNNQDRIIFLSVEEPSVVAAANKAFKLSDGFFGEYTGSIMLGHVYIKSNPSIAKIIRDHLIDIERLAREKLHRLEKYGGGFVELKVDDLANTRGEFTRLEFRINVGDAMGANIINSFLEEIADDIQNIIGRRATLKILSNLSIYRRAIVRASWGDKLRADIESKGIDYQQAINDILDVISLAQSDIYRKTTYNKGIMNGISAAALAYGQDWRAIEAAIHTYSNYFQLSLTNFWYEDGKLHGKIEVPIAVGTVGGSIKSLNHAKTLLELSNVKSSGDLAILMAAVGLANNFGANYHLAIEGIQRGHMKLHARNIAISVGAKGEEIDRIVNEMVKNNRFSYEYAKELLGEMR
ncbi:MAG: hypothetical protein QW336_00430 [Candidatus Anstonellales archaeon]